MKPRTTSRRYSWRVREATSDTGISAAVSKRSAFSGPRKEILDLGQPQRLRPDAGDCEPHIFDLAAVPIELDQRSKTHQRNDERSAMTDFLETASMLRQRVTFDGGQQFAIRQRGLVRPGNEIR